MKHNINIYCNNTKVGIIEINLDTSNAELIYDKNWKNIGFELSPHLKFDKEINFSPNITYLKLNSCSQNIVDNLPNCIEKLELGTSFDSKLDNLPTSIRKIIFYKLKCSKLTIYDFELNCLPNFVEFLQLPKMYDKRILRLPDKLKQIACSKDYKYVNDFSNYDVMYI